jgi:hypothetical protein
VAAALYAARQILGLQFFLPIAVIVGVVLAIRNRDVRVLSPLSILGGVLLMAIMIFLDGKSVGFLRYYISAIPLGIWLVGNVITSVSGLGRSVTAPGRTVDDRVPVGVRLNHLVLQTVAAVVGVVVVVASLPIASFTIADPTLAPGEGIEFRAFEDPGEPIDRYQTEEQIAHYLDGLHLPTGSVLIDTFSGVPIVMSSNDPRQFVITSDRDFPVVLADPGTFGVRYILVEDPHGLGSLDAVNREFPTLYSNGAGFAALVRGFRNRGTARPDWRLYRILDSTNPD